MCDKAVERGLYALRSVPDQYKTREMRGIATERNLYPLEHVPDQYKTQVICERAVKTKP